MNSISLNSIYSNIIQIYHDAGLEDSIPADIYRESMQTDNALERDLKLLSECFCTLQEVLAKDQLSSKLHELASVRGFVMNVSTEFDNLADAIKDVIIAAYPKQVQEKGTGKGQA